MNSLGGATLGSLIELIFPGGGRRGGGGGERGLPGGFGRIWPVPFFGFEQRFSFLKRVFR